MAFSDAALLGVLLAGAVALSTARAAILAGEIEGYRYVLVVPDDDAPDGGRPLVVLLHGCQQSAAEIRALTRFDTLGAQAGFAVLYPETRASAGNPLGCWAWWLPENQVAGSAEPAILVAMVQDASARSAIDRRRVYALGLSSGGAMSAIVGALYPEVFAAVGVHSGVPYAGASIAACVLKALADGGFAAEPRAAVVYHAQGPRHRVMPVMVVHGSEDRIAAPVNCRLLIEQLPSSTIWPTTATAITNPSIQLPMSRARNALPEDAATHCANSTTRTASP